MSASPGLYKKPWRTVKQYDPVPGVAAAVRLCSPLNDGSGLEPIGICAVNKAHVCNQNIHG